MNPKNRPILISACLIGINCRYDGTNAFREDLIKRFSHEILIPVCPEQLGGLTTPRPKAEITPPNPPFAHLGTDLKSVPKKKEKRGVIVIDISGRVVTREFKKGAKEVLKIAKLFGAKKAVLKEKSPSCGVMLIYKRGRLAKGQGITTRLLKDNGIEVEGAG